MLDDLYASQNEAIVNDLIARPPAAKQAPAKFNAWKFTTAAPRGVAVGATEATGSSADILGAFGQIMAATDSRSAMFASQTEAERQAEEKATSALRETGPVFDAGDQFRRAAKQFMPDPQSAHTSETLVFGLGRFATKAVGYTAMGGPVVGAGLTGVDEGLTAAQELKDQGVDINTRTAVGAVSGVAGAAGVLMPVAGKNIAQTAALVATGGPGAFMAQQATTRKILQDAGYDQIGMQYDPFDPVGLAVSMLVPAGFGAFALRGAKIRERASTEASARMEAAIASDRASAEIGPPRPTPEQVDAARVEMLSQHMESARLTPPEDMAGARAHDEAMTRAMDQLAAGERVQVADVARGDVPAEFAARIEAVSESTKPDPNSEQRTGADQGNAATEAFRGFGPQPHYAPHQNLSAYFEAIGLTTKESGSSKSGSRYVTIDDPVSGDTVTVRFADHQQTGNAMSLHSVPDFEVGNFKGAGFKTWEEVKRAVIDRFNGERQRYGDELLSEKSAPDPQGATTATTKEAANVQDAQKPAADTPAGAAPQQPAKAAQPQAADAGSAAPAGAREQGSGGVSRAGGDAAEATVVGQRLADIQAQFPDLTVQMDGMDGPVKLSDFLEQVQREAMEGTDFELGANDAPLMQVAASCFLVNGA